MVNTPNITPDIRTGFGYDVHRFDDTKATDIIRLGGVDIPHARALSGHSDADVALHALTDAILGSICAGDIGQHFPPSDQTWKNADSALFLKHAHKLLTDQNGFINHLDLTIICEAPKIGPYRHAIIERLAEILDMDQNRISVKATTTEKLGFTGRKEGIAAQAVVTVYLERS